MDLEKNICQCVIEKGLISKIYKWEKLQLNNQKTEQPNQK